MRIVDRARKTNMKMRTSYSNSNRIGNNGGLVLTKTMIGRERANDNAKMRDV